MNIVPLGLVKAAISNTPVPLATVPTPCQRITFRQAAGATGIVFIGSPSMNPSTGAGVYATLLPAASSGISDQFQVEAIGDELDLEEYAVASGTVGQGAFVSYQVR